jgi:acetyl-CoA acetyltransferase
MNPNELYDFKPEDISSMVNPLDLPPEQVDAILGSEFMGQLRVAQNEPLIANHYTIVSIGKPKYTLNRGCGLGSSFE